jgi:glutaminase
MDFNQSLRQIYDRYQMLRDGEVAEYIPQLATVDPDLFAISAVTTDGRIFEIGDTSAHFTIQSTSKPFGFALALEKFSLREVLERVGVEPTGEDFNSISKLDQMKRPMNPMVNAGAISVCSMLKAELGDQCEDWMVNIFGGCAGQRLAIDRKTYESEMQTTDGNRAITYLLRKYSMLASDPQETLDLYVKLCSLQATTTSLATMGATLANQGVNPFTRKRWLRPDHIRDVLSVMLTCGMYNYAGQWVFDVGLPAKSGVSGAVLMIVPGVMAIAVYSPRLDKKGTSVRGIAACKAFSQQHSLHLLDRSCPKEANEIEAYSS